MIYVCLIYSKTTILRKLLGPLVRMYVRIWRCPYFGGFKCTHVNARDCNEAEQGCPVEEVAAYRRCPLIEVSLFCVFKFISFIVVSKQLQMSNPDL